MRGADTVDAFVQRSVAAAPPLTDQQPAQLSALIRGRISISGAGVERVRPLSTAAASRPSGRDVQAVMPSDALTACRRAYSLPPPQVHCTKRRNLMPWFRVDHSFWSHPKTLGLSTEAVALWVRAGSYAMQHLTGGRVAGRALRLLGASPDDAAELVSAGLWEMDRDGWRFHDWDEYQPSADSIIRLMKRKQAGGCHHQSSAVARGARDY